MWDDEKKEELLALCDLLLDGRLEPEAKDRLEALVLSEPGARKVYVEYLQLHAALRVHGTRLGEESLASVLRSVERNPDGAQPRRQAGFGNWWGRVAAAFVLGGIVNGTGWLLARPSAIAVLEETSGARWESCTVPTQPGAKLAAGRLHLGTGLARLVFRSGAELTLEGPAELELIGRDVCRLDSGAAVVHVSHEARGFRVQVPQGDVTDLGTEFGVRVDRAGNAAVQVLEGRVAVRHGKSGRIQELASGEGGWLRAQGFEQTAVGEGLVGGPTLTEAETPGALSFTDEITTRTGRGAASYVWSPETNIHFSDTLLLLKNVTGKGFVRKAVVRFDLQAIQERDLDAAQVTFNFIRTGFGYAALNRDSVFAVYGVTDDLQDSWDPATLGWETIPAFSPEPGGVDSQRARRLGTFRIPRGTVEGVYTVGGEALADFLRRDENGLATLVVVCETEQARRDSVVFGFAGNRHPTLAPPTLRLRTVAR
jgi:DNA-binding TFAR19-related protein (PDSD5 family)